MTDLLQHTLDGLLNGAAYALIGLGLSLSFGTLRRLNLAHGAMVMLAAYVVAWCHIHYQISVWLAALLLPLITVLIGLYVEQLCFSHDTGEVVALASSFALWMQLEQLAVNLLPLHLNPFPSLAVESEIAAGALVLRLDRLLVALLAVVLILGMWFVLARTRVGLAWRASAGQRTAAHLAGLNVRRVQSLAFACASALAGIGAFAVLSLEGQVTPMVGMWMLLKGLTAAMLGGLGSMRGVLVGGLLLGVVETHVQASMGALWREFAVYALLFLALVWPARALAPATR
jgi:branched-chain amino acid transport system permease protein